MNKVLILPVEFAGMQSRVDRTLKMTIVTQEISADTAGTIYGMQGGFGYVAIKKVEFEANEREILEGLEAEFVDDKKRTPSQRLRAVLYLNWKENDEGYEDFKKYYGNKMERIIEHYRAKLP